MWLIKKNFSGGFKNAPDACGSDNGIRYLSSIVDHQTSKSYYHILLYQASGIFYIHLPSNIHHPATATDYYFTSCI